MIDSNAWSGPNSPTIDSRIIGGGAFDQQVAGLGERFGWARAHVCPCAFAGGTPGSPNPECNTCFGKGVYWDAPIDTSANFTFMHTSAAPDEPGVFVGNDFGRTIFGEPIITLPNQGTTNENTVWLYASTFDAYVQYDARVRFYSTLVAGQNEVLPYQFNVNILQITTYDPSNNTAVAVAPGQWAYSNGVVTLGDSYAKGTAYTVEYVASPVFIAFRKSGGMAHTRPLAGGTALMPKRFHVGLLDVWLRASSGGAAPVFGTGPKVQGGQP